MRLVGCGGGAAALVPYCAEKMGLPYSIPDNAEVISSIGVALAMVRDVIERVIPNPTQEDIKELKKEAIDAAINDIQTAFGAAQQDILNAQAQAQQQQPGANAGDQAGNSQGGDHVTDVDFEEVK